MSFNTKKYLSWAWWGLVVLAVLYVAADFLIERVTLARYERTLTQLQHPIDSVKLDTFSLPLAYYPATYVDEAVYFQSGYVAGELRRYAGTWELIEAFYAHMKLNDGTPVYVLPIEYDRTGGWTWFEIPRMVSYDPLEADVSTALREHYSKQAWPASLNDVEDHLYLVYGVWLPKP